MSDSIFSIITVSRNSSATVARTIESVLNQTLLPHEYIMIDGASTDGTVDIIKSYEGRFRDKGISFLWSSEPDKGIYNAMNKGLARARGDIIGIINSDDWYESDAFSLVDEHLNLHPEANILYGMLKVFSLGQPQRVGAVFHANLNNHTLPHPATFVRKNVYDKVGNFSERYRIAADYDFFLRARTTGCAFSFCPHILANFSSGGASDKGTMDEREKALVQLSHGIIGRKKYSYRVAQSYLHAAVKKLRTKLPN